MQRHPPSSRVIRRFGGRMGEKVEEIFPEKNREKIAGPEYRATGPSRHAEAVTNRGAEFVLSDFLSLSVSHARRALPVRSSESLSTRPPSLLADISLYSQEPNCSSTLLSERRCPHCWRQHPRIFPTSEALRAVRFDFRDVAAVILILASNLLATARQARAQSPRS